ncbi:MAG TPA: bifunctional demethylmenaquinone methyltransferase/2-methoxy-6-polyprenyl-1,4-benzoquinol methylase UbiE [Bryobacteraceae bacterium]|nr:bifunctional demethylmenaquinone methyltransferase/2-methoxy-6-polyprenyl-1,4-benzoquinol methylase UbiE [Bryobacteraceae bacterium]
MSGTTPRGITDERAASAWVRDMFGQVAPRYDLLNHLLSFNIDRLWRATAVRRLSPILERPGARVLDLCCGTGDLAIALRSAVRNGTVAASDFCHPMLVSARRKSDSLPLFEADAMRIPVADASFDLVSVAFGFRNLANYEAGLREGLRVLRPGGTFAILEFSTPPNALIRAGYHFYSNHVLTRVGAAVSGAGEAYRYLPESVRKFPDAPSLAAMMREQGFREVRFERFTFGVVALHTGVR